MQTPYILSFSTHPHSFKRVLANQFKHSETRFAIAVLFAFKQVLVEQRLYDLLHVERVQQMKFGVRNDVRVVFPPGTAYYLRGRKSAAANEYAHSGKQNLLGGAQQVI